MDMLPVAILAGGLATRMRPLTETLPKSLLPVLGEPFIAHQLRWLASSGFRKVVLCTGFLGEQIEAVVGDGHNFGLDVTYSPDGPRLLGTGGAIRKALPLLGDAFFVLYGDSFLTCDYQAIEAAFVKCGKKALMTVLHNKNQWDKSNVIFENGELKLYDKYCNNTKMHYIDYGLCAIQAKAIHQYTNKSEFDISELYNKLSKSNDLHGYEVFDRFYEIGSFQGLQDTEEFLSTRYKLISSVRIKKEWGN